MTDQTPHADSFYEGLCNVAYDALKSATEALRASQVECARLKRQIAESPSLLTELQDRVTMLESLRKEYR